MSMISGSRKEPPSGDLGSCLFPVHAYLHMDVGMQGTPAENKDRVPGWQMGELPGARFSKDSTERAAIPAVNSIPLDF